MSDHVLASLVIQARTLLDLGAVHDAAELLPSLGELISSTRIEEATIVLPLWAEVKAGLVSQDALDWAEDDVAEIAEGIVVCAGAGAIETGCELALVAARLCLEQGSLGVSRALLDRAAVLAAHLDPSSEAVATLHTLTAVADAAAWPTPPATRSEAAALIDDDPTVGFDLALRALARWPAWAQLARQVASQWEALGFVELAQDTFATAAAASPEDDELVLEHGQLLLRHDDWAGLHELVTQLEDHHDDDLAGHREWLRCFLVEATEGPLPAAEVLHRLATERPDWISPVVELRRAMLLRRGGALEPALAVLDRVIEGLDDDDDAQWDRIVVGTRMGRWDVVHAAAAALGMAPRTTEGPIDEDWGRCMVAVPGRDLVLHAARRGPVTARIAELSGGPDELLGSLVVFDPEGLELDGDTPAYLVEAVLEPSPYTSWAVHGVALDDPKLALLRDRLAPHGGLVLGRVMTLDDGSQAAVACVVWPVDLPADTLVDVLQGWEAEADASASWPELADHVGEDISPG